MSARQSLFGIVLAALACSSPASQQSPVPAPGTAAIAMPPEWSLRDYRGAVTAEHGMVATDAPLATAVGANVLRGGGNAVDAAVATAFALAVVLPQAGNLGGGGFFVVHMGDGREATLDFREVAPGAATRDMYLAANGHADTRSITGLLSAGVPGSVAGLWDAHERFGSKPWAELIAPAITLADSGFVVDDELSGSIRGDSARLVLFAASRAIFFPGGKIPAPGQRWRNPDLATTLRRVAADGPKGFYTGRTAELVEAEMKRGGGIMTQADLAAYRAKWRTPIEFSYREHRVISMPPPSSGGITMAIAAHELAQYDFRALGWHSPEQLHLLTEAMRRGFAVRNGLLGDPDFVSIPTAHLLSQRYADSLSSTIEKSRATPSSMVVVGQGATPEKHQTTHFSVLDGHGGAVAATTTLNGSFGSAAVVPGAGFLLNDEMDDFASEPGKPNMFGLVQGEANAIAPGKRMLSSMTPTIVLGADGKPMLVTGASGGPTIISTAFEIMSNVIDYDMDIGTAVSAPRVHHQHLPDTLYYDAKGLTPATLGALTAMGYNLAAGPPGDIGIGASILARGGRIEGTHDPRVHGAAAGY